MNRSEEIRKLLDLNMEPAEIVAALHKRGMRVDHNLVNTVRKQREKRKAKEKTIAEAVENLYRPGYSYERKIVRAALKRINADMAARAELAKPTEPQPEPKAEPISWDDPFKLVEALRVATGEERHTEGPGLLRAVYKFQQKLPEITAEEAIRLLVKWGSYAAYAKTLETTYEADEETLAARRWGR